MKQPETVEDRQDVCFSLLLILTFILYEEKHDSVNKNVEQL